MPCRQGRRGQGVLTLYTELTAKSKPARIQPFYRDEVTTGMEALKVMQGVVEGRHGYARGWKEKRHRPVVGYLCTWVPEELIFAAGGLPVRVLGSHEPQDVVEPHIFSQFCPYSRDCLAQGLLGRYNYLHGIVYAHGCYHIRQTFDSWQRHIPTPLAYFFFMPTNVQRRGAKDQVVRELEDFKEALEKHTGRGIGRAHILTPITP